MNNDALTRTNEHKYLEIMLTSNLKWNAHIIQHSSKSKPITWTCQTSLHMCKTDAKYLVYASLVRSHFEYASSTWNLYSESNKHKLESVQHRAARFVSRNYDCSKPVKAINRSRTWLGNTRAKKEGT